MLEKFECPQCKKIFKAKGEKIKINNYLYGSGWKRIAKCSCGAQAEVYAPKKDIKKKKASCGGNCSACPYQ